MTLSYQPSDIERDAFLWLQGRMIELLLRHDAQRFTKTFGTRQGDMFDDSSQEALQPYRELAVLFYLRDELLESILPRIKRRLSFVAPREIIAEDMPARGRIDWPRTMAASLRDRPGELPSKMQTRQRRRHFDTSENLLTVVSVLEYADLVQQRLETETARSASQAFIHPLRDIVDRLARELSFPQFTGLVRESRGIIDGQDDVSVDELEQVVSANLVPGRNSAYDDLIDWRHQLNELRLLDRTVAEQPSTMLGADPERDNYVYQCWLFYELGDMLQERGLLLNWDKAGNTLAFQWGSDNNQQQYELRHDRSIQHYWQNAPGVRPDLYISRTNRQRIVDWHADDQKRLIWQEPGYVLDAKFYRPRNSQHAPGETVKRMIADIHLTGERNGALLFAFQYGAADVEIAETLEPGVALPETDGLLYQVSPYNHNAHALRRDIHIDVWRVRPRITEAASLHSIFTSILDTVHAALSTPTEIKCYGFLADADTVNPSHTEPERCPRCQAVMAFCPKPHVGPERVDRVCPRCDCLQSARLCHILPQVRTGIAVAPPFVQRVLSEQELQESIKTVRTWLRIQANENADDEQIELARDQMFRTIGELTDTYIRLTRADTRQTEAMLREWVFGQYWSDEKHPQGLPEDARQMLVSGEYVWSQFQHSSVDDWAACAVQYTRALEHEIHTRFFDVCEGKLLAAAEKPMESHRFMMGSLASMRKDRKKVDNWRIILDYVATPSNVDETVINAFVDEIEEVRRKRNKVAHSEHVDTNLARELRDAILGQPARPGLLYRLVSTLKAPSPTSVMKKR